MSDEGRARAQDTGGWAVAIGASGAQGLDDIRVLLALLPAGLRAIVLVVLHRPSDQVSHLRAILGRASRLPVQVVSGAAFLEEGCCYIGEPDNHLRLTAPARVAPLRDRDHVFRNRTIDLLFRSVAEHTGPHVIGVILSGSLDDGSRGLEAIHQAGGWTMVLTPLILARKGMPENAIAFDGPIDVIGSLEAIAAEIVARVGVRGGSPGPGRVLAQL